MLRIIVPIGILCKLVYSMDQFAAIVYTDTGGQIRSGGGIFGVRESLVLCNCCLPGLSIYPSFDIGNLLCQTLQENNISRK